jgi:hypothetical protein
MSEGQELRGAALWGRALLLAALAVLLGAGAHLTGDGRLPGPAAMAGLVVLVTVAAAPLLRRPASALRIGALLGVGQGAVHLALSVLAGHAGDPGPARQLTGYRFDGREADRTGSLADQVEAMRAATAPAHGTEPPAELLHHVVEHLTGANAVMALAHLLVAGLLGLWLAMGERALCTLLALAGHRVHAGFVADAVTRTGERIVALLALTAERVVVPLLDPGDHRPPRQDHLNAAAVVHRGPPLLAA